MRGRPLSINWHEDAEQLGQLYRKQCAPDCTPCGTCMLSCTARTLDHKDQYYVCPRKARQVRQQWQSHSGREEHCLSRFIPVGQLVKLLIDRVIVTEGDVETRYVIPTDPGSEHVRFCHLRSDYSGA